MTYRNYGVSLISIIITVLIIAILTAVMIPSGIDKINDAKLTSFNDNILTLKQETNMYLMKNDEYPTEIDDNGNPTVYSILGNAELIAETTKKGDQNDTFYIIDLSKLKIDNKDVGIGKTIDDYYIVAKISGNVYYAKGNKIGNITYYTKQNKSDGVVAVVPTSAPSPVPNGGWDGKANSPKLAAGMTPVKWNGSSWADLSPSEKLNWSNEWYDYSKSSNKWANVRLNDGSLLVWIPRYTYKISSGYHTSGAANIDIKFSNGTADDTSDSYIPHPAFYWGGWTIPKGGAMIKQTGGTELTGIWVGKFEPSKYGTGIIKILPNSTSWVSITVDSAFTESRQMQTTDFSIYGISSDTSLIDTHMLKNSEWGAVVYLSKYALGETAVALNANTSYITANGDIVANKSQSTTGTEYGVYDMNGCAREYLAAYIDNSYADDYGNSLFVEPNMKYKDVLPKSDADTNSANYDAISQAYGHALYETSNGYNGFLSWYTQYAYMPYGSSPWITRGGNSLTTTHSGIFCFYGETGATLASGGFRVGICVP